VVTPVGHFFRVAAVGLNATQREHEAATRVGPVCAQRHHVCNVKGADHFASAAQFDAVSSSDTDERVVHQAETFLQWCTHVVAELNGAAPVLPSAPSTTMKSGVMPVANMALTMANHSHG
jgi:hypothetical protein